MHRLPTFSGAVWRTPARCPKRSFRLPSIPAWAMVGGLAGEFYDRVTDHYRSDAAWKVEDPFRERLLNDKLRYIKSFEPRIADSIFRVMLSEAGIEVLAPGFFFLWFGVAAILIGVILGPLMERYMLVAPSLHHEGDPVFTIWHPLIGLMFLGLPVALLGVGITVQVRGVLHQALEGWIGLPFEPVVLEHNGVHQVAPSTEPCRLPTAKPAPAYTSADSPNSRLNSLPLGILSTSCPPACAPSRRGSRCGAPAAHTSRPSPRTLRPTPRGRSGSRRRRR